MVVFAITSQKYVAEGVLSNIPKLRFSFLTVVLLQVSEAGESGGLGRSFGCHQVGVLHTGQMNTYQALEGQRHEKFDFDLFH